MKLRSIIAALAVLGCVNVSAAEVAKSTLAIDNIQIGKMDGDAKPYEFSVVINFRNTGEQVNNWKFGFYMPRSFDSLASQHLNPDLTMQICEASGNCVNLRYVKASSVTSSDWSQGSFTVLEPIANFPLKTNTNYYISLAHNNQGGIHNISDVPQSMFIIKDNELVDGVPKIYSIASEASQYQLLGYNQINVDAENTATINHNWQNSAPTESRMVQIVPSPVAMMSGFSGDYTIPSKSLAIHNQLDTNNAVAKLWAGVLKQEWKIRKDVTVDNDQSATSGIIIQSISDPRSIGNNPEGYRLSIGSDAITIEALTATGAYYGLQTLRQIYAQSAGENLPGIIISDYPRFKYRGIMLDTARHYFSVAEIKNLIDVMANQKLNTLHIHFADDEAFRLAIPEYPTLASIGANRGLGQTIGATDLLQNNLDTANLSQPQYPAANTVYGGSYSPADIKTIISYANDNQITVIPEIDIPGHARALIKALPQAMVDSNDKSQYVSIQGYSDDTIPVCTYGTNISVGSLFTPTINNIVTTIANQFSGQSTIYAVNNEVSLGGDEVVSQAWTNDSSCRNEWSDLSALDKSQLFMQKLAVANTSLMISGWQQIVQTESAALGHNLVPTQMGHVWVWNKTHNGVGQAVNLARNNYPTVLAYSDRTYFDQSYTNEMMEPGLTWANSELNTYTTLSVVKDIQDTIKQSTSPQNILGIEGALWSENLASYDHLMYMALPRMPALAEASWSPEKVTYNNQQLNWQDLATRLGCGGDVGYLAYLHKQYGVNYRGYPNGIAKEIPSDSLCQTKSELTPPN